MTVAKQLRHTPAPWTVDADVWSQPNGDSYQIKEEQEGEKEGNTALIAAAPDLLAELEWITTFCQEHADWFAAEDGSEGDWLERAQAAIAKARGQLTETRS